MNEPKPFELQVIEDLSELKTGMVGVKEHLAKLNGKVAAHEEYIVGQKAVTANHDVWKERLKPIAYALAGALLMTVKDIGLSLFGKP